MLSAIKYHATSNPSPAIIFQFTDHSMLSLFFCAERQDNLNDFNPSHPHSSVYLPPSFFSCCSSPQDQSPELEIQLGQPEWVKNAAGARSVLEADSPSASDRSGRQKRRGSSGSGSGRHTRYGAKVRRGTRHGILCLSFAFFLFSTFLLRPLVFLVYLLYFLHFLSFPCLDLLLRFFFVFFVSPPCRFVRGGVNYVPMMP